MEMILGEIERAVRSNFFYLAIALALTLPDICSALQTKNGKTNDGLYRKWIKKYLKEIPGLSPSDCWSLRCGVIHEGNLKIKNEQKHRVIFTLPHSSGARMLGGFTIVHQQEGVRALQVDAVQFCEEMIAGVRAWYKHLADDPVVLKNLPGLVRFRPYGMYPFNQGIGVIG
jgi:hypothetical protein